MESFLVKTTKNKEIVDLTYEVESILAQKKVKSGIIHLFVTHTTASITCADLDPGTDQDMLDAFNEIVPKLKYRHPHDPTHVGDHIMSSIIGSSVSLPFKNGKLILGTWQRVVLVELDGPRERRVIINII